MVEPAVPFYGLRFRIFESEVSNPIELKVRFRHFAHTMGSRLGQLEKFRLFQIRLELELELHSFSKLD